MKRLMPTHWLLLSLLVMLGLWLAFPGPMVISRLWNLAGMAPIAFGVWINLAADRAIHRAGTTVKPFGTPTALITDGVYGISRHPMYLGFTAILIGVAVLLAVLTPFLVVVVFVLLMEAAFIKVEEHNLEHAFGRVWLEYRRKVRRWI